MTRTRTPSEILVWTEDKPSLHASIIENAAQSSRRVDTIEIRARRAGADGTGLGLALAQKIVHAPVRELRVAS